MGVVSPREQTYHRLADDLARAIEEMQAGDRLPSEHELVARHDVSRITARAALGELERRHLVRRARGSGTFVALRLDYPVTSAGPPSFSDVVTRHGHAPSHRIEEIRTLRPPRDIREVLALRPGAMTVRVRRIGLVDGDVVNHQTHWIPAALVPGLRRELETRDSLFRTLVEAYGFDPRRFWSRAELATVTPDIAEALGFEGRPQAWNIESCNRCRRTGRIIELAHGWLRADAFRVRFEHGPTDGATPGRTERGPQ